MGESQNRRPDPKSSPGFVDYRLFWFVRQGGLVNYHAQLAVRALAEGKYFIDHELGAVRRFHMHIPHSQGDVAMDLDCVTPLNGIVVTALYIRGQGESFFFFKDRTATDKVGECTG